MVYLEPVPAPELLVAIGLLVSGSWICPTPTYMVGLLVLQIYLLVIEITSKDQYGKYYSFRIFKFRIKGAIVLFFLGAKS